MGGEGRGFRGLTVDVKNAHAKLRQKGTLANITKLQKNLEFQQSMEVKLPLYCARDRISED